MGPNDLLVDRNPAKITPPVVGGQDLKAPVNPRLMPQPAAVFPAPAMPVFTQRPTKEAPAQSVEDILAELGAEDVPEVAPAQSVEDILAELGAEDVPPLVQPGAVPAQEAGPLLDWQSAVPGQSVNTPTAFQPEPKPRFNAFTGTILELPNAVKETIVTGGKTLSLSTTRTAGGFVQGLIINAAGLAGDEMRRWGGQAPDWKTKLLRGARNAIAREVIGSESVTVLNMLDKVRDYALPNVPEGVVREAEYRIRTAGKEAGDAIADITPEQWKKDSEEWTKKTGIPGALFTGTLDAIPLMVEGALAKSAGTAVAGPVGGHLAGWQAMANNESALFYNEVYERLEKAGFTSREADKYASVYAIQYGQLSGAVEYAGNAYQMAKAKIGGKKAMEALRETTAFKMVRDRLFGGASEGFEEALQTGLSNYLKAELAAKIAAEHGGSSPDLGSESVPAAAGMGFGVGVMLQVLGLPAEASQRARAEQWAQRRVKEHKGYQDLLRQTGQAMTAEEADAAAREFADGAVGADGVKRGPDGKVLQDQGGGKYALNAENTPVAKDETLKTETLKTESPKPAAPGDEIPFDFPKGGKEVLTTENTENTEVEPQKSAESAKAWPNFEDKVVPTAELPAEVRSEAEQTMDGSQVVWRRQTMDVNWLVENRPGELDESFDYDALAADIRKNGLQTPIVYGPAGIEGNHRIEAARRAGLQRIPAWRAYPVPQVKTEPIQRTPAEETAFYESEKKRLRAEAKEEGRGVPVVGMMEGLGAVKSEARNPKPKTKVENPKSSIGNQQSAIGNVYMRMPIERVREDAKNGVTLAKEALKAREQGSGVRGQETGDSKQGSEVVNPQSSIVNAASGAIDLNVSNEKSKGAGNENEPEYVEVRPQTPAVNAGVSDEAAPVGKTGVRGKTGGTQKPPRPVSDKQRKARAEFARRAQPVDQKLADFRKLHPFVRAPKPGDPVYKELMGNSKTEQGPIPRRFFKDDPTLSGYDEILDEARQQIPHIIGDDDLGQPYALGKIYGFKIQTVGQREAIERKEWDERAAADLEGHVLNQFALYITDEVLPPQQMRDEFPEAWSRAVELAGVDEGSLIDMEVPIAPKEVEAARGEDFTTESTKDTKAAEALTTEDTENTEKAPAEEVDRQDAKTQGEETLKPKSETLKPKTDNLKPQWSDLKGMKVLGLRKAADSLGVSRGGTNAELRARIAEKLGGQVENEMMRDRLAEAGKRTDTNPTEGQKEAENYKVGRIRYRGWTVSIENPKGSVRSGQDADGNEWSQRMANTYGRILGVTGADGDNLDVFFNDASPISDRVFIVNQVDPKTGLFDEEKVMLGFQSAEEAKAAYLSNYSKGWKGLGSMEEMSWEAFDALVRDVDAYTLHLKGKKGTIGTEAGEQRTADGRLKTEDGGRKTEDGKPKSEILKPKTDDGELNTKGAKSAKGARDGSFTTQDLGAGERTRAAGKAARTGAIELDGAGAGEGNRRAVGRDEGAGDRAAGDPGVSSGVYAVRGARGDNADGAVSPESGAEAGAAGDGESQGSGVSGTAGVQSDGRGNGTSVRNSSEQQPDGAVRGGDGKLVQGASAALQERVERQRKAESIPAKVGDAENIRETLPVLFTEQHDDVIHAENRLLQENKHGMLFTNGTGTGKTFTGLGIVKRFLKMGRREILILTPKADKNADWKKDAALLGIEAQILDSTTDGGQGVTITTYANFYQNRALAQRDFDLVVYDESHKLDASQNQGSTVFSLRHKAITKHPKYLWELARERSPKWFALEQRIENLARQIEQRHFGKDVPNADPLLAEAYGAAFAKLGSIFDGPKNERIAKIRGVINATMFGDKTPLRVEHDAARNEIRTIEDRLKGAPRGKAVFLSASPFAYHVSLDYAEGYLFDYDENQNPGYNVATGLDKLLQDNFGYQMRTGKLNSPDAQVNVDLMERTFFEKLKKAGAVRGRQLKVGVDYSRHFVDISVTKQGALLNNAFAALYSGFNNGYDQLRSYAGQTYTFQYLNYMMESMKAAEAVKRTRKHLALGRKVVLFHSYKKPTQAFLDAPRPFRFEKKNTGGTMNWRDRQDAEKWNAEVDRFYKQFPELENIRWNFPDPLALFSREFGEDAVFVNGGVASGKRSRNIDAFNRKSGPKVIVMQIDAGKEGTSLHDTDGDTPRAIINIGLPYKPMDLIQSEGRIYRLGSESNAVYEYLKLGLNFEQVAFNQKISTRSRTAENLALGNLARDMEQVLKDGYLNSSAEEPSLEQGTGGKAMDARVESGNVRGYDYTKTFYWAKQKRNSKTKAQEGSDYFATPEPVGFKMVQWAGIRDGDKVLEPSAGDGAIGRWFPENTNNTFVEPSYELMTKLQTNVSGSHNRFEDGKFEDLYVGNKFNAVVMNPPFGTAGKTAVEHLAKAFDHLRNGGRVVALIPEGPAADAKFDKWFESDAAKNAHLAGVIHLPTATFERAGTQVKTRIVIIDRQDNPNDAHQRRTLDFSNAASTKELFDRMEDVEFDRPNEPTEEDKNAEIQRKFDEIKAKQDKELARGLTSGRDFVLPNRGEFTTEGTKGTQKEDRFSVADDGQERAGMNPAPTSQPEQEATRQLEEVRQKYAGSPLWMKAPNGKPTKLNERQWLQVRTPNFKAWFGDWEGVTHVGFLNGAPVKELSGNEFRKTTESLVDRVTAFFAEIGNQAVHPVIGAVALTERGVRDSISHGLGAKKAAAFAAVPDIIERGVVVDVEKNWKGRHYDGIVLAAPVSIAGKHHIGLVVVHKDKTTQRFYLQEVALTEEVREAGAFKTEALTTGNADALNGAPLHGVLRSILQGVFSVNPASVSQVVDENGEPMVVYHGTGFTDITRFLPEGGREGDWQRALEHFKAAQSKNEPYGYMNFRGGTFFSPDAEYAGNYTAEGKGVLYPVFIKASNPVYFDQAHNQSGKRAAGGGNPNKTPDGLILHMDGKINEVAVIDPVQVKSAIGNNGRFDGSNQDLRFSVADEMQRIAGKAPSVEFSREAWNELFPDGRAHTPVGVVKLGEHQFDKMVGRNRQDQLGMMHSTITDPALVVEEPSGAWAFLKAFSLGEKVRRFMSVAIGRDGERVVITNHLKRPEQVKAIIKKGRLIYKTTALRESLDSLPNQPAQQDNETPDGVKSQSRFAIAGRNAATAGKATGAANMERAGVDREMIWQETGWWRGPDGKWRFEVDDSDISLIGVEYDPDDAFHRWSTLADVISHPALFEAYPDLKKINTMLDIRAVRQQPNRGGFYQPYVNREGEGLFDLQEEIQVKATSEPEARKLLMHEIQHAIQHRERFANGGNVSLASESVAQSFAKRRVNDVEERYWKAKAALAENRNDETLNEFNAAATVRANTDSTVGHSDRFKAYQVIPGEIEARLVETRLNMDAEERKAEAPWVTMEKMLQQEGLGGAYGTETGYDTGGNQAGVRRDGRSGLGERAEGPTGRREGGSEYLAGSASGYGYSENVSEMGAEARRRVDAYRSGRNALDDRAKRPLNAAIEEDLNTFEPDYDRIEADGGLERAVTGQLIVPVKTKKLNGFLSPDGKTIFISTSQLDSEMNYDQTRDHETAHVLETKSGELGDAVRGLAGMVDTNSTEFKAYHAYLSRKVSRNYADQWTASEIVADFTAGVKTHFGINLAGAFGANLKAASQSRTMIKAAMGQAGKGKSFATKGTKGAQKGERFATELPEEVLNKPVQVIDVADSELSGSTIKELRRDAVEKSRVWWNTRQYNADLRADVLVNRGTLEHLFVHSGDVQIFTALRIPEIVKGARTVSSEPHDPPVNEIIQVHRLVSAIRFRGNIYAVDLVVKEHSGTKGHHAYDVEAVSIKKKKPAEQILPVGSNEELRSGTSAGNTLKVSQLVSFVNSEERFSVGDESAIGAQQSAIGNAKIGAVSVIEQMIQERAGMYNHPSPAMLKRRMKTLEKAFTAEIGINREGTQGAQKGTTHAERAAALGSFARLSLPESMRWQLKGTLTRLANDPKVGMDEFWRAAMNKTRSLLEKADAMHSDPAATVEGGNVKSPKLEAMTAEVKQMRKQAEEPVRPVTESLRAEFYPEPGEMTTGATDPVIERAIREVAEMQRKTAERAAKKASKKGRKIKMGQFDDISRAFGALETKTGIPFFQLYRRIFFIDRDIDFNAQMAIKQVFDGLKNNEGKKARPRDIALDPVAEAKIILFLDTGTDYDMTPFERTVAERIDQVYKDWEPFVKEYRHQEWMREGNSKMPGGATLKQMEEGKRIFKKFGKDSPEYRAWIDVQTFGIREAYSPKTHEQALETVRRAKNTSVGSKGFLKQRDGEPENKPLVKGLYLYIRNGMRLRDLQPHLTQMENLFNENVAQIDPGVIDRFFNNLYMNRMTYDVWQEYSLRWLSWYFRVQIPQKVAKWSIRNALQVPALVVPNVASLDRVFIKNIYKLTPFSRSGSRVGLFNESVERKLKAGDRFATYFHRYVNSMEQQRNEMIMLETDRLMGSLEPSARMMEVYDAVGRPFSFIDEYNRAVTFVYGFDSALDALVRYRKKPTWANYKRFLRVTGMMSLGDTATLAALNNLLKNGQDTEAAYLCGHYLADRTQFRYARSERGAAWQEPGKGLHIHAPISTYWRGGMQMMADQVRSLEGVPAALVEPLTDLKAYLKDGDSLQAAKARRALAVLGMLWFVGNLCKRAIMNWFDTDETYDFGWKSLFYVPGSPVGSIIGQAFDMIKSVQEGDFGLDYQAARITHMGVDSFVPFYHLVNQFAMLSTAQETGDGEYTVQQYYKLPMELRRVIKNRLAELSGTDLPADQRKWVELQTGQMVKRVLMDGATPSSKQKLEDLYGKWLTELNDGTYTAELEAQKEVEKAFRKYPLGSKQAFTDGVPAEGEAIERDVRRIKGAIKDIDEAWLEQRLKDSKK